MRAKKFGVTDFSSDAKKLVRAERFGKSNDSSNSLSNKTTVVCILIFFFIVIFHIYNFRHQVWMYLNKEQKGLEGLYHQ